MPNPHVGLLKFWRACIVVLFILISQPTLSLPDDRNKLAYLSANSADLKQQIHRGEYIGNVQVAQGTTHLYAVRAITQGNAQNKLIFAVAFGDKDNPAHYWEQTAIDKPILHAYAQEIRYYPERRLIELLGEARIIQGEDSFTAPKITYDTLKQHVTTSSNGKGRTVIITHPRKTS